MAIGDQLPAIYYHPDGYDTVGHPLMGRRAAGKSFLNAWFDRYGPRTLNCFARSRADFDGFCKIARERGANGRAHWIPDARPELLAPVGALYFPGPDIGAQAWRRNRRAPSGWSIIGVTHTICTQAVMDGVSEWHRSPVEDWDAVICTSRAVRDALDRQLEAEREFLAQRLGATRFARPRLPVIPLGVATAEFAPDPEGRRRARARFGVADNEIVALFVGRLSIYGKAHPSPMFIALERAARQTGKQARLLLAGWFPNDAVRKSFDKAAATWCPSVKVQIVDGRDDVTRRDAWWAGDIFISLVDNIQETFGLTPVEAMAAGLPAVVSDWDGYRDTVRHGVDGFRVPTIAPPAPFGDDLIDRYAANIDSYDLYLARSSALVVVDIECATSCLARLMSDSDLRARMGAAGLANARARFDWRVILDAYAALFGELAERRRQATIDAPRGGRWPSRLSPFDMFASYPTRVPALTDRARVVSDDSDRDIAAIAEAERNALGDVATLVSRLSQLRDAIARAGSIDIAGLLSLAPSERHRLVTADILTLAKFGVIRLERVDGSMEPRASDFDILSPVHAPVHGR